MAIKAVDLSVIASDMSKTPMPKAFAKNIEVIFWAETKPAMIRATLLVCKI